MILSIGEILADMTGEERDGKLSFSAFCGGAPFNLAVSAKRSGAKVAFLGRVGDDPVGKFVIKQARKANLDKLDIQTDKERNTTIAFVTLSGGERDFAFYRRGTADYFIDVENLNLNGFSIVHLGSLMLSEREGACLAEKILKKVKSAGKLLSFDVNFRMDLYPDFASAKRAYAPFIDGADIVKFSEDELYAYTGVEDTDKAAKSLLKDGKLILVTLGGEGSAYYFGNSSGTVATEKVKPVDTTGAGDAFFGAFIANIENKELNTQNIVSALKAGNAAGAAATQYMGAVEL